MSRAVKGDLVKRLIELLTYHLIYQSSAELCQCESLLSVINIQHHISVPKHKFGCKCSVFIWCESLDKVADNGSQNLFVI